MLMNAVVVVKCNVMIVMSDGNVSCGECNGDGTDCYEM
jgi:hypothetical protein